MSISFGPNLGLAVNGVLGESHYSDLMKQWRGLDALVQPTVKQVALNTPPGSPADGDAYIVGAAPSGAWSSAANKIARYSSVAVAWEFYTAKNGWKVFDQTTSQTYSYNGSAWAVSSVSDSLLAHLAGTETITGAKTFSALATFTAQVVDSCTLTATGAGNNYGVNTTLTADPAGSSAASFQGMFQNVVIPSSNAQNFTNNIQGHRTLVDHEGTGTLAEGYGCSFRVKNGGGGVITSAYVLYAGLTNSSGTIGTAYGLYIEGVAIANVTTPYSIYTNSGKVSIGDDLDLRNSGKVFRIQGTQVVAARKTGWGAWTGTATRTTKATYSGTASAGYVQAELQAVMDAAKANSEALKALIDDLHNTAGHGLIGT